MILIEFFQKAGPLIYPLIFANVWLFACVLERFWFWSKTAKKADLIFEYFQDQFFFKKEKSIAQNLKKHPFFLLLENLNQVSPKAVRDLVALIKEEVLFFARPLEKNLKPMAVIGTVAPLIGLLGTILGIMTSFNDVVVANQMDPVSLANGIWQALITTFSGMVVAIPAWVFYYYFDHKAQNEMEYYDLLASRFLRQKILKSEEK